MKDIGKKHVVLSGFRIPIPNASELDRTVFGFTTRKLNGLVRSQSLRLDHCTALDNPVPDPSLQPGDKEDFFLGELMEPGKIQKGPIHHHNGEGRKSEKFGYCDIGYLGSGDLNKCWDVPVVIQKGMQLDATLGGTELGPREERQAEIHYGGVKGIELVFEPESLSGSIGGTFGVLVLKESLEELSRTLVVSICKGCSLHCPYAQVVEFGTMELELMHNISQAGSSRDLGKHHDRKLAPAVQGTVLAPRPEAISFDPSKIMSVKKLKQLMKDCVRMRHGLNLLSYQCVIGNHTISRKARFGPILFP